MERLIEAVNSFVDTSQGNYIQPQVAFKEEYSGCRIFDQPLIGFGDVHDPWFLTLQKPEAVGPHFKLPLEWNEKGKTVVSVFLPFSEKIKQSNQVEFAHPSDLWLHGRIEGQAFCNALGAFMVGYLEEQGYKTVSPCKHKGFKTTIQYDQNQYTSNWSERHVGFVCGLGTFGLSKGLITKKGMAGRLVSVVTEQAFEKTKRGYTEIYEYCTRCGACIQHCPAQAISLEKGKEHLPCSLFLDSVLEVHRPYYGCGKCQVNVPCMSCVPPKSHG